ncbi:MAG: LAGLIDADG family homing endonuclease [Candidatus Dojkabacteria bacterium]
MSLRADLLTNRYLLEDETEDQMWCRVAEFVSSNKYDFDACVSLLKKGDIIFNSPILMNAGKEKPLSSACYVLPMEDDMDSIMDAQALSAKIFKLGAGVGIDYSRLRKEGAKVGSGGTSSGPVSFMSLVDNLAEVIKSGGKRRAAIMATLRIDHPDVEFFIEHKKNDDKLLNTNISVMITDEFMNKVKLKEEKETNLWNKIVHNAWLRGDPGLVFIDTINKNTNRVDGVNYEGVNACVIGSTKILTDKGHIPISELVGEKVNVWNGEEWSEVEPKVTGRDKKVYTVLLSNMEELTCTDYHRFKVVEGYKGKEVTKTTSELKEGDRLIKFDFPEILTGEDYDYNEMYTNGFFSGDGFYAKNQPCIPVYSEPKLKCAESFNIDYLLKQKTRNVFVLEKEKIRPKYWVPDCSYSPKARVSWLAGLIDSDGCVNTINKIGNTIAIASTNLPFLKEVRYMLSTLGCSANISTMHLEGDHIMPDGKGGKKEYHCKQVYRMFLTGKTINQLIKFGMETKRVPIAFYKNVKSNSKYISVVSVTYAGIADKVYCFNESKRHMGVFANTLTCQCGEFPLYPYESCLIGSINFSTLDTAGVTEDIKKRVTLLVRCLDNVIDKAWYPDKKIEDAAKRFRRIGVGFTGLADYLIKSGLRYGSKEALDEIHVLLATVEEAALSESKRLAMEKGTFPAFDTILWDSRLPKKDRGPVRNIATTVVAPAGSTSILCNADGSGCEPLFALAYDRMMRGETENWYTMVPEIVKYVFDIHKIDLTEERIKSIKQNRGSVQGLSWVPECIQKFLVTAQDITPDDHLNTLIAVQEHIGNSVSKTINLPNSATEQEISNIFMKAYDNKVKGITVFRDGCKSTQVLKVETKEESTKKKDVTHLPNKLPCVRIKVPTPSGSMYVMTSFYDSSPVEVFCNLGKSGMDDYAYTEALGRLISLCLKKGIDYHNIVKTLKGIRGKDVSLFENEYVYSVPDAIAIALRESVDEYNGVDNEKEKENKLNNNLCPECNMPLQMEGKCPVCLNCGYNKCS